MDLGLKGKVALVAGGSMGLGRAVALELAREGAKVAIGALDDPHLNEAANLIRRETGGEVLAVPADVSDAEQARAVVRTAIDHFGTLDILVNNAGGPPAADFLDIDETLWEKGFRLNLLSTILMTREAVPVMKAKRLGPDHQHDLDLGQAAHRRPDPLQHHPLRRDRAGQDALQ